MLVGAEIPGDGEGETIPNNTLKLRARVCDILSPTTAVTDYAITGLEKLSAHVAHASTNKTKIV